MMISRRERQSDQRLIQANGEEYFVTATSGFKVYGRGAVWVDTTTEVVDGGHPVDYLPQSKMHEDDHVTRLVKDYDPTTEFVVLLVKSKGDIGRTSAYRIQAQPRD